jgi:hypothetical protein
MTITIECTELQARTITTALDLLMRIHMGQWYVLTERLRWHPRWNDRDCAVNILTALAMLYTQLSGPASHSINSPVIDDEARIAADIRGMIRHVLWTAQPEGERIACTVDSAPPMRHSNEPLPQVTVTTKGDKI